MIKIMYIFGDEYVKIFKVLLLIMSNVYWVSLFIRELIFKMWVYYLKVIFRRVYMIV